MGGIILLCFGCAIAGQKASNDDCARFLTELDDMVVLDPSTPHKSKGKVKITGKVKFPEKCTDPLFNVSAHTGYLNRIVEVYQWHER